jgi:hypothetical protein
MSLEDRVEQLTVLVAEILIEIRANSSRVDARFDSMDNRFESMDQRFDSMDQRFNSMDQRFDSMDQRFEKLEKRIAKNTLGLGELRLSNMHLVETMGDVLDMRNRVIKLEEHVFRKGA